MQRTTRIPAFLAASSLALTTVSLAGPGKPPIGFDAAADAFLARHPGTWDVSHDPVSNVPRFVWGDRIELGSAALAAPASDAAFEAAARAVLAAEGDLFGIDGEELALDRVWRLDLAAAGRDKVAVTFRQSVSGVPVFRGSASVLFDAAFGAVLALDFTGVPHAARVELVPATSEAAALAVARVAYRDRLGVDAARVDRSELVILGPEAFGVASPLVARGATLAWQIELATPESFTAEGRPAQARVHVSAAGDATLLDLEETALDAGAPGKIGGNVCGNVNLGPEPNTPTNQELPHLKNLWVRRNGPQGPVVATSDANGDFSFDSNVPVQLWFQLQGPYSAVTSWSSWNSAYAYNVAPGGFQNVLFNPAKTQFTSAEMAAAKWIDAFRDFVKEQSPADPTMDFQVVANVNKKGTCNAFWNGTSINFYVAGTMGPLVCKNSAYRSGVHHEEGHWANSRYNGNVTPAFHEGVADAWSYFINDDPCFWPDYTFPGCTRNGEQIAIKKCKPDATEQCHGGEPHREGEAIASALWKTKRNLKNANGAAGGVIANKLFIAWMQAYNDFVTANVILDHWLALDDDNGTLTDGTPHLASINGAFVEQGWAGFAAFKPYGAGCLGSNGKKPELSGMGTGATGSVMSFKVANALPFAAGTLNFSFAKANQMAGFGCTVLVGALSGQLVFGCDGAGNAYLPVPIVGYFLTEANGYVQAALADPGAGLGITFSNGLVVRIKP